MKTSKQALIIVAVIGFATFLVSWNRTASSASAAESYQRIFSVNNPDYFTWSDEAMNAYIADNGNNFSNGGRPKGVPAAEDVLVQRIPGDNYHMLMMAVYSFDDYSAPSFTMQTVQGDVTFRDDGKEYDKIAGDGIYTAKIVADVADFRRTALKMVADMKKNGVQFNFYNRQLAVNPNCALDNSFDLKRFDNNEAVGISNLTGGSNDLIDSVRNNCIFITNLNVVEDPTRTWNPCTQTGNVDGPWTFKTIFKNLAKQSIDVDPTDAELSDFVLSWLHSWQVTKVINGDTVPPRPQITDKVILPWLAKSEAAGAPPGQLDMRFAPFKLTAIVNRFDLRERAQGIPAGEGRFTFCLIDSSCTQALQMTMVIEFAINSKSNCDALQAWALRWFNLKDLTLGSPEYNAALQDITDQFAVYGTSRNGTIGLDALRTNEREFYSPDDPTPRYEFREFGLVEGGLTQRILEQIPQDKYNVQVDNDDVRRMVGWENANKKGINNDDYVVPDSITGVPFLGGHAQILDTPVGIPTKPYHWDGVETKNSPARVKNTTTRHIFSRNTCTGCHAGEIQTFFTHVDPVFFGTETTLSGFLSGTAGRGGAVDWDGNPDNDSMMVKDAAGRGGANNSLRMFNDILRRAKDLKDFALTPPCATAFGLRNQLMFKPMVGSVH